MSSSSIYSILSSIPHNKHYLQRYVRFINACIEKNAHLECTHFEKHHILPKASKFWPEYSSFKKNPWNLAKLTPRQHYISHWILAKAYGSSMWFSFYMMTIKSDNHNRNYKVNSLQYESIKINTSLYQKKRMIENNHLRGVPLSDKHKEKLSIIFKGKGNPFYGKTHSEKTKEAISKNNKGKLSGNNNPMYGKKGSLCPSFGLKRSNETKQKIKDKRNETYKLSKCPHCNK